MTDKKEDCSVLTPLLSAALDLYKPPFSYDCGYIHDGDGRIFSDDGADSDLMLSAYISRVRGWGRLSYIEGKHTPDELQDAIGEHIARALNEYWAKHQNENQST